MENLGKSKTNEEVKSAIIGKMFEDNEVSIKAKLIHKKVSDVDSDTDSDIQELGEELENYLKKTKEITTTIYHIFKKDLNKIEDFLFSLNMPDELIEMLAISYNSMLESMEDFAQENEETEL